MNTIKLKNEKGITLIALIITIIILVILAVVSIRAAYNSGIIDYSVNGTQKYKEEADKEESTLTDIEKYMGSVLSRVGKTSGITINLSISGTTVNETNPPIPTGFYHVGNTTIADGYVISDVQGDNLANSQGGNQFVWVPVQKDQVINLSVTSKKDITSIVLYNPYGDKILDLTNQGKSYSTTINTYGNMDCVNGKYTAVVKAANEEETKELTVRSLYAIDVFNDYYTSDEYAKALGFTDQKAMLSDFLTEDGIYHYKKFENEDDFIARKSGDSLEEILANGESDNIYEFFGFENYQDYKECINKTFKSTGNELMKTYEELTEANDTRVLYSESVNNNGGFYIGRYEAGATMTKTSGNNTDTASSIIATNGVPVCKANQTPYNYIIRSQAEELIESMYNSAEFICTLPTGSAWDRTLGFLTESGTGSKTIAQIANDSKEWGNFKDAEFTVTNTNAQYSTNHGRVYTQINNEFQKTTSNKALLTTGAADKNMSKNIYDLAGNLWEFTSESIDEHVITRGGRWHEKGDYPANYRNNPLETTVWGNIGFRPALFIVEP